MFLKIRRFKKFSTKFFDNFSLCIFFLRIIWDACKNKKIFNTIEASKKCFAPIFINFFFAHVSDDSMKENKWKKNFQFFFYLSPPVRRAYYRLSTFIIVVDLSSTEPNCYQVMEVSYQVMEKKIIWFEKKNPSTRLSLLIITKQCGKYRCVQYLLSERLRLSA